MFLLNTTEELTTERICEYIKLHRTALNERYEKLESYYKGEHDILLRKPKRKDNPCNNVVCNYAKYITDIGSGFLIGEPVSYQSEENDLTDLLEWFKAAEVDVQDNDNAEDQSIYGVAYELVYMSSDKSPTPKTASIHPSQAFVIYNDTVELNPVAGVYYHETRDTATQQVNGYDAEISTDKQYIRFHLTVDYALDGEVTTETNPFGMVTLIEIYNNRFLQGDFEQLISLIDGYNKQQSNRIDDKEAFVNSLMVLKGQTLGDTSDEKAETVRSIKENGVVELTPDGELSFLTRQADQQGDQLLSESLAKDIHKFSYIPDLTDEHFAANVSGVAMQFKLWGLLQLMKKKERYIKEGQRYRIKLFSAILAIKGKTPVDASKVTITMTRNLPKNLVELAQVIGNLSGICSNETLVAQLPFVEDPEKETQKAAEEKQAAMDAEFVMASKSVNDNDTE
jgi:SPP1 family phage portal protein